MRTGMRNSGQVIHMMRHWRVVLGTVFAGYLFVSEGARAQSAFAPPLIQPKVDENSVDLFSGHLQLSRTDIVIGQPGLVA
jgi:hypothetical protein